jgi:hypothetical protein
VTPYIKFVREFQCPLMTANKFTSGLPITYQAFLRSFPFNMPRDHFIAIPFKNLNLKIRKQLIVFQNGQRFISSPTLSVHTTYSPLPSHDTAPLRVDHKGPWMFCLIVPFKGLPYAFFSVLFGIVGQNKAKRGTAAGLKKKNFGDFSDLIL